MKKILLLTSIFAFILSSNIYSQIGITSYSIYALGINTNKKKKFSGELKTFLNREIENTSIELCGMYNFRRKDYHQFSIGAGLNFTPFIGPDHLTCFSIPLQLEVFPLQNFKQLSFVLEVAPELYPEEGVNLRHLWGIRYSFKKK